MAYWFTTSLKEDFECAVNLLKTHLKKFNYAVKAFIWQNSGNSMSGNTIRNLTRIQIIYK